jgi:hypothetical protein
MSDISTQGKQRAVRVKEVKMDDGRIGYEYSDGTIRDSGGRAMALPEKMREHAITSDRAREMIRLREEKRRRLYAIGAQRMVQNQKLIEEFGEDAHLVDRAMTLQQIATTPDAGKAAVMADTALQRAQGYDVKPTDLDNVPTMPPATSAETAHILARVLSDVIKHVGVQVQIHETIDGEIAEE